MLDHLIENGAYSEADAARLMHEVASAMAFLHGVGVVHADLKPENLLLSTKNRLDGTIKLIDFGCAVLEDVESPDSDPSHDFGVAHRKASSTGTTAYWPPERFQEGSYATPAMDMWSVGVILYIMLTGCHPYDLKGVSTDEEVSAIRTEVFIVSLSLTFPMLLDGKANSGMRRSSLRSQSCRAFI